MKTNKVLVQTKQWTTVVEFKKAYDLTKKEWIEYFNENMDDLDGEKIINVYDANKYHACQYCGSIVKGSDEDILCDDCIMTFRHCRYSDLWEDLKMTNLDKLKLMVKHLQFMIDEGIVTDQNCGTLQEEIYSAMEVLVDCNDHLYEAFNDDLETFKKIL